jgi:hypothetical protein
MNHTARLEDLIDAMFTVQSRHCRHWWWKPLQEGYRVTMSLQAFKLRRIVICTRCGKVESR